MRVTISVFYILRKISRILHSLLSAHWVRKECCETFSLDPPTLTADTFRLDPNLADNALHHPFRKVQGREKVLVSVDPLIGYGTYN